MRRFAIRFLIFVASAFAILALTLYFAGGVLVAKATTAALPALIRAAAEMDGELRRIEFESTALSPFGNAEWQGLAIEAVPPATQKVTHPSPVRIRATKANARLTGLFPLKVDLEMEGIRVDAGLKLDAPEDVPFGKEEFDVPLQKVDGGRFSLPGLEIGHGIRTAVRQELPVFRAFLREGTTARVVNLTARLHFKLNEIPMAVRLETARVGNQTRLRINRADLDLLSQRYDRPLTVSERELLAENPLKAPVLLRIKEYAERSSRRLAAADRAFNEDSTRHVLWSYWLTKTFGPEFAERVTEAHEVGSSNSAQESTRDRANNQLGREWAESKRTEGQVVHLAKSDPRVIR